MEDNKAWGFHTQLDLYNCDPNLVRSEAAIKKYVDELCDLIDMKKYGDCIVVNFGEDDRVAGFSMFQLIETSNISGHFRNENNTIYLDIFSCKYYDVQKMIKFSCEYFKAYCFEYKYTERF